MGKTACRICEAGEARYRCPCCHTETCNVACAKIHKDKGCSGRRPIERKSISDMTDQDLVSDVNFLQRIGLEIESGARLDSMLQSEKFNLPTPVLVTGPVIVKHSNVLPVKILRQKAAENHVILRLAPASLSRRKENTTTLTTGKGNRKLRWRTEWLLITRGKDQVEHTYKHCDKAISHDSLGRELVSRFTKAAGIISKAHPIIQEKFTDSESLTVLMRDEALPANERGYLRLDLDKRLKEWIAGTLIVEFPTFIVVPADEIGPPVAGEEKVSEPSILVPHYKPVTDASRGQHIGSWRGQKVYEKLFTHTFEQTVQRVVPPVVEEEEVLVDLPEYP